MAGDTVMEDAPAYVPPPPPPPRTMYYSLQQPTSMQLYANTDPSFALMVQANNPVFPGNVPPQQQVPWYQYSVIKNEGFKIICADTRAKDEEGIPIVTDVLEDTGRYERWTNERSIARIKLVIKGEATRRYPKRVKTYLQKQEKAKKAYEKVQARNKEPKQWVDYSQPNSAGAPPPSEKLKTPGIEAFAVIVRGVPVPASDQEWGMSEKPVVVFVGMLMSEAKEAQILVEGPYGYTKEAALWNLLDLVVKGQA